MITREEVERRQAARAAGLPLSASWEAIRAKSQPSIAASPSETSAPDDRAYADRTTPRDPNVDEKTEQRKIREQAVRFGFRVYWLSQAGPTGQTKGVGDLWLVNRARGLALWWESKRQVGGKRRPDQVVFGEDCAAAGVGYGYGDRYDFDGWLIAAGLAVRSSHGLLEPTHPTTCQQTRARSLG